MQFAAVQCSAIQYSAVQSSTMQCCAVQCSTMQYSAVQAVWYSAVQCSAVRCSAVQCMRYDTVQCCAVQCSTMQCSAVQWWIQLGPMERRWVAACRLKGEPDGRLQQAGRSVTRTRKKGCRVRLGQKFTGDSQSMSTFLWWTVSSYTCFIPINVDTLW